MLTIGTVMGRPSARTVAIRDQILAALRTEWPLPISTRRVCELLGAHRYSQTGYRIYPQLCALDRLGLVERIRRDAGCRDVFWRFLGDPTDADLNAVVDATDSPQLAPAAPTDSTDQLDADTEVMLSTLDSYIKSLDAAETRFVDAAASGDQDKETDAADDLAALVRQFVNVCTNWPGQLRPNNAHP
ncbi:hypothetical protein [Mycolicibacterium cosmeticum]|uniref:hypothetical protein n=1 Tax=Mycolicibacterium cosmeticum TaxID=258533 RepID=UPI003204C0C7